MVPQHRGRGEEAQPVTDRNPEFGYAFLEEFQERPFWGTDIPNEPQKTAVVEYFPKLNSERLISDEAYGKITWRNANRLLALGVE